ncbi:hypothetical protein HPO96_14955 [Kribbella sandramycini]|uniref:Lipoprotein LprG n=1 Tax=Kribbella sandramycini TaxID=60450 RepID=A0A7Y4KZI8_9ACTN|nr:hypothetical protein [Kribbella sandramycini]MBB6565275.1 hypothetical protein [Kribbella sandramycini]NOL41544.1 hypothetical protein [Kribbella sandramycini]
MKFRAAVATAAALPLALGLAACGGSDKPAATGPAASVPVTSQPVAEPQKVVTPTAPVRLNRVTFVPAMNSALTKQKSWRTVGKMTVGGTTAMTITGIQTANPPAMSMQLSGPAFGEQAAKVIVAGGAFYASIPGATPAGKWVKTKAGSAAELDELLQGGDPTKIFKSFDKSMVNVKFVRAEKVAGQQLDRYTVTVDTLKALKLQGKKLPAGVKASDLPKTLAYTMWMDADDLVRRLTFDLGGVAMEMTMSDYNKPVTITAPPANKIVKR